MKVYTFSTGGCKDGIYMDSFSSTIEGVSRLIQESWFNYGYSKREFKSIQLVGDSITVYYVEFGEDCKETFELIVIEVV